MFPKILPNNSPQIHPFPSTIDRTAWKNTDFVYIDAFSAENNCLFAAKLLKIMKVGVCLFFPVVSHGSDQFLQPTKRLQGLILGELLIICSQQWRVAGQRAAKAALAEPKWDFAQWAGGLGGDFYPQMDKPTGPVRNLYFQKGFQWDFCWKLHAQNYI